MDHRLSWKLEKAKVLLHNDMGNLIPLNTQIESKNGEVLLTINLNLNIKLDSEGKMMSIESSANTASPKEENLPDMKKVRFEKPDIGENSDIIQFGKQV